jgi:hypothetical protein
MWKSVSVNYVEDVNYSAEIQLTNKFLEVKDTSVKLAGSLSRVVVNSMSRKGFNRVAEAVKSKPQ